MTNCERGDTHDVASPTISCAVVLSIEGGAVAASARHTRKHGDSAVRDGGICRVQELDADVRSGTRGSIEDDAGIDTRCEAPLSTGDI